MSLWQFEEPQVRKIVLTMGSSVRVYGVILFILLLVSLSSILHANEPPLASKGALDLTNWDFIEAGNINLKGEWEFYWDKLIPPEAFLYSRTPPPKTMSLPQNWNGFEINEKPLGPEGFATFRLLVKLKKAYSPLALKIPNIDSAYKLWINGKLIAENGQIGKTAQDSIPQLLPLVAAFANDSKTLDIVIQVSNFGYTKGGIWSVPLLGLQKNICKERENQNMISLFLVGSFVIMCLYHLGLYLLRSKETITLIFCLICLSLSFRILVGGEALFFQWFSSIPWEVGIKLAYTTFILPSGLIILFFYFLFPQDVSKKIISGIIGTIFFALALLLLLSPLRIGVFLLIFEIAVLAFMVYSAFFFPRVIKRKRQGAIVMLLSLIVLIASGTNDILNDMNVLNTGYYTPFGMFTLIFSQSWILAKKFTNAFNDVENLTEQLLKVDKLKDEFLANTSHELRTPLNGIIGIAESLIDGATGKQSLETSNNLNMIVSSGKRLTRLVKDILDFSKMKHQEVPLNIKAVDIKILVDMVLMISRPMMNQKPVEFVNCIPEGIPLIKADEDRLQQIFINLISNAIKFTHQGKIIVSAEREEKGQYRLSVKDTGIGIAKKNQNRIFKYFEQADGSISREFGGSGLGLAVTKKLVELHGSVIIVESAEGIGSTFSFSLPVAEDQTLPQKPPSDKIQSLEFVLDQKDKDPNHNTQPKEKVEVAKEKTILVVDDEVVNIQVLKNQLSLQNYRVLSAPDGFQALKILEQEIPDLIVLDLMMPRMSGYEVCQKIRMSHSPSSLPILMLTARNQVEDLVKGFSFGANDYLAKPFNKEELLSRIRIQLQLQDFGKTLVQANLELEKSNQSLEDKVLARTKDLSSANDQLKHMLHILCHDLQNPLAGLFSLYNMVNDNLIDYHEVKPLIKVSLESGLEIINLVRQMRSLEEEKFELTLESCGLKKLLMKSRDILSQMLIKKNINLVINVSDEHRVKVEKTSFVNTVINNIVSNAIKFSFPGSIIDINARQKLDKVIIDIIDHGIGIPEKLLGDVFNMGKHTSREGTNQETGTGFGMPLVKKFVMAYDGTIEVLSKEKCENIADHGTMITLTLKVA